MPFLILMTLFNSLAHQLEVINTYRFEFGGISLGSMEGLLIIGFAFAVVQGATYVNRYPNARTPNGLVLMMAFLLIGGLFGLIGAVVNDVPFAYILRSGREYFAWPVCIFIGYRLLPNPAWAKKFCYVMVVAGLCTSTMLLLHWSENAELAGLRNSFAYVRTVWYVPTYAALAALVLMYTQAAGRQMKLMPWFLSAAAIVYCLLGYCAPMHRSDWLALVCATVGLLFILPHENRTRTALRAALVVPVLLISVLVGVRSASALTGRDYWTVVVNRVSTMLPGVQDAGPMTEGKAWDTRVGSIFQELQIWTTNPLMGEGFAVQEKMVMDAEMADTYAYNHNGWASVLAKTGICGFIGSMMIWITMLTNGRRLVREGPDQGTVLIGVLTFVAGILLLIGVLTTMFWTTRQAMVVGVLAGMAFRARAMMPVTRALQEEAAAAQGDELFAGDGDGEAIPHPPRPAEGWGDLPPAFPPQHLPDAFGM